MRLLYGAVKNTQLFLAPPPVTGAAQTKNYYDIGGECWWKEVANERNLDDIFRKGNI